MAIKPGLGRGLDMLLSAAAPQKNKSTHDSELKQLPIDKIQKGAYQPRLSINPDALQELAESIKAQGIVQPVIVRRLDSGDYELIAGERRWRAAQMAGLHDIPAIVRVIPDQAAAAMALIENIQPEDLTALEESIAMSRLISEFGLTHQETAKAVGRSRTTVTNLLRLLALEDETKTLLDRRQIDMGHARALLALEGQTQCDTARKVAQRGMSVRGTERLIKNMLQNRQATNNKAQKTKPIEVKKLEQSLSATLGAEINIKYNARGKGKLVIAYNSLDELDGILEHIK